MTFPKWWIGVGVWLLANHAAWSQTSLLPPAPPGSGTERSAPAPRCLEDLKGLCQNDLLRLYRDAALGTAPVGSARGRVLLLTKDRLPRIKAAMANTIWEGKEFGADGSFINRWRGGWKWLDSHVAVSPSWYDGQPTFALQYPAGTPFVANARDEVREIAPGLYMGPVFDRCPVRLRGFIAFQLECRKR